MTTALQHLVHKLAAIDGAVFLTSRNIMARGFRAASVEFVGLLCKVDAPSSNEGYVNMNEENNFYCMVPANGTVVQV